MDNKKDKRNAKENSTNVNAEDNKDKENKYALLNIAQKNVLRKSEEPEGDAVKGYDFNKGVNYEKIIDSFSATGFQATNLGRAINIINEMRKEKCKIYLGYTSNLVTSGLRDIFRYLVQHKMVDVVVTTAGGIEEDIIKCFAPFLIGDFYAKGVMLREKGINRTGNIFVPNSRYCKFEEFFVPLLERIYQEQKKTGKIITPSGLAERLGKEIDNKESIYYWCYKNNIPVFCPAITDGSMGDMIYFFTYKHEDFKIDDVADIRKLHDTTIKAEKTGIILLGSGIIKHHICNSNMFRNGADYAVFINNSHEFDGSDSGARPDEAVSWGKILPEARMVKVFGDATILFPLIAAKCFNKV